MSESEKKEESVQARAEGLMARLGEILAKAQEGDRTSFDNSVKSEKVNIEKMSLTQTDKKLIAIPTTTFLDKMFLDREGNPINGIPFGSNSILTGLPNSGKTVEMEELVLRLSNLNHKVLYVITEEVFRTGTGRYDVESRLRDKANIMKLDYLKLHENLFIIDTVTHAEFREWSNFVSAYRTLVEDSKIDMVFIDSMTLLEDSRGQIKFRILDLARYNQIHGITSIMINQRGIDESDSLAMAGGISLSHIVDVVMVMDYKKAWSGDAELKADTGCKQGDVVYFLHILKCRLCGYDAHYKKYTINKDGFVVV